MKFLTDQVTLNASRRQKAGGGRNPIKDVGGKAQSLKPQKLVFLELYGNIQSLIFFPKNKRLSNTSYLTFSV
jgi:hypothetical protein